MGSNRIKQIGNSTVLLLVILALALIMAWQQGIFEDDKVELLIESATTAAVSKKATKEDVIASLEVLDVNYWEARFKVGYQHRTGRGNGYLSVTGNPWTPNVGLKTSPGQRSGVSLLSRRYQQVDAYTDEQLNTRMYDPYRADHAYAKRRFDLEINWPGTESLPAVDDSIRDQFSDINQVVIYRNVPDYVGFAEKLYQAGFPPAKMTMMLAVCRGCKGSLIYGDDVSQKQLQAVIKTLKEHDFPLQRVAYSADAAKAGNIYIGNSPPQNAKPLWANVDQLINPQIENKAFFDLLGFPLQTNSERAIRLTSRAKSLIDAQNNLRRARTLLDKAINLDGNYIPAYLESARLIMRSRAFSERNITEPVRATARAAKQVLRSAIKIAPDYADSYVLLGYTQTILQNFDAAKIAYDKAEQLGSDNLWLFSNLALMYRYQNDTPMMIKAYENVLAHKPEGDRNDRPLMFSLRALADEYYKAGRNEESFSTYAKMYNYFPTFTDGVIEYINLAVAYGKAPRSVDDFVNRYKVQNCPCAFHADAMRSLLKAAELLADSEMAAIKEVIKVQSTSNLIQVVADLLEGEAGRQAVQQLIAANVIEIDDLEESDSLLLLTLNRSHKAAFKQALQLGAGVDKQNSNGFSPLIAAVSLGRSDLVELLLSYGADKHRVYEQGYSAVDVARRMDDEAMLALLRSDQML